MKPFHIELIPQYILDILPFLKVTFLILISTLFFGAILGAGLAKGKLSKNKAVSKICFGYTTAIRCTPTIVLLFLVYYGVPRLIKALGGSGSELGVVFYVIVTYVLLSISELSEVMRSSYEAVPKGQREAGISIGLTEYQTFWHILLPQAFKIAIPNLGNTVILLFKEGSIAYIVGLLDIMGKSVVMNQQTWGVHSIEIFVAVSLIYWAISVGFEQLIRLYENHQRKKGQKLSASERRNRERGAV